MSRVAPASIVGKIVGPVGFGLMDSIRPWAPIDYSIATKVMKTALDQGANYWNGGLHYGTPTASSLHLLKHYFTTYPEDRQKVILSIKGAYNAATHEPDCSPEGIKTFIETALSILEGTKKIDIFECTRVDPNVPIEASIATLAENVNDGKIGGIGISEATEATIR
ncbi:NADP-dependent oxidoreductase domain-containing protein [Aspergillus stella-maris]|uniref:NADP-dependent oxidoreductase domain-containing protein n=1 Tax=Aspergillus stella-maris TaxID=1810926 RepID=UPI003CCE470C